MKNLFDGYYPPTDKDYERLWKEGLIVLDTNVLLYLYKVPASTRAELLGVLKKLESRLWIPHQVALEFQNSRLKVISSQRKTTGDALTSTNDAVAKIKERVGALEIDKRNLGLDPAALLEELDKVSSQLQNAITRAHEEQLDISGGDPIREQLDQIFSGRVGGGPSSQSDLDALVEAGEERFRDRVPPGFMDADKDGDPTQATFVFDNIRYPRKFGDLILWRQLIQHVSANQIKEVLFITADNKGDWWWREQGKTIGPHPQLIREIKRHGSLNNFWMYSLFQFMENANTYVQADVSRESLDEIQEISTRLVSVKPPLSSIFRYYSNSINSPKRHSLAARALVDWIVASGGELEAGDHLFPDFIVNRSDGTHGYEMKVLRNLRDLVSSPLIQKTLDRGHLEVASQRLGRFHLVLVIPTSDRLMPEMDEDEVRAHLQDYLQAYSAMTISVGIVIREGFVEWLSCSSDV